MKKIFFIIVSLVVMVATGHAQLSITHDDHCLLPEDSLCMEVVDYTDAGLPGEGQTWDFSHVSVKDNYECHYMLSRDSLSLLSTDNDHLCAYYQTKDSLLLLREENNLYFINYEQPPLVMLFPMNYGDMAQRQFNGDGVYCGRIFLHKTGTALVEADGLGTLIRADGDTLHNVLRVHSITTSSVCHSPDSLTNRTDIYQQEITEHYKWYAQGSRYPVYETITTTCYFGGEPYAIGQTARRYLGNPLPEITEENTEQQIQEPVDVFSFSLTNSQNHVTIDYSLATTVRLQFIVTDVMGILQHSNAFTAETGNHQYSIDCLSLKPGQYIVYINVGGTIYNSKFTRQ